MDKHKSSNYQHWHLTREKDIFWLTFDQLDNSVNTLHESTLHELEHILEQVGQDPTAKALIIRSGKKSGFIAGADVNQFKSITSSQDALPLIQLGQRVFDKLEQLNLNTIALIEGFCLGGGFELALACRVRLAEDASRTRIGLPEVRLGIQPGWGGSVRLCKLIGAPAAMEMILSGKTASARTAKKLGMIQDAVPKRLLEKAAREWAAKPFKDKFKWQDLTHQEFVRPILGKIFKAKLRKKVDPKHYPAPFAIVDNWVEFGIKRPQAMQAEMDSICKLVTTETAKNLLRVFFLQEQMKNFGKKTDFATKHVHVIGAGVMGGDIAAWCALKGLQVTVQDQTPKLLGSVVKRTYALAQKQLKEKNLIQAVVDRLQPDPMGRGIAKADVIIEAIPEKLELKKELFAKIEKQARQEAILATNTSTIPLEEIASALTQPQRLVGIHFFNPVTKMPLIEIVKGEKTQPSIMDQAMAFAKQIDRLPLPVKSSPGFLVNRILLPYMLEAVLLLEEGIPGPTIDQAALDFGMPMGPVELADVVGLDVCMDALEKMASTTGSAAPAQLRHLVARGDLGKKTGKGFYEYRNGRLIKPKKSDNVEVPVDITYRLVSRLLNEAVSCLREGIVESADLLDAGCIFGFGFPPFRGGPMAYIHEKGKDHLMQQLVSLAERYGSRFTTDTGWEQIILP